ncbi:MAG: glycosyltransferase family 2 protein [bacterium]|mgnify:CR=1 FL=1|nr:glycosyltransferase family 2 protein [bacterium]
MISVIIPTFNGKDLLKNNLPNLINELSDFSHEIIVSDDGSTDDTIEFLKDNHKPYIKIFSSEENKGFSSACNSGLQIARGDYILLLNNDVSIKEPFLKKLLINFNEETFCVVPRIRIPGENNPEEGFTVIDFSDGDLKILMPNMNGEHYEFDQPIEIPHGVAACALYSREKLLDLGGFDTVLNPYFWEDVDLSTRALKKGWKIIYDSSVSVIHEKSRTVHKYYDHDPRFITNLKNRLLFTWKQIDSKDLIRKHYFFLNFLVRKAVLLKDINTLQAFDSAIKNINNINRIKSEKLSLSEIIEKYGISKYEKYLCNSPVL